MKTLVVLVFTICAVVADVSELRGYNYNRPSAPSGLYGPALTPPLGNRFAQLEVSRSGFLDYSSGASGGGPAKIVKPVIRHGEPIVSKSFYVHHAPEEPSSGVHVEEKEHIVHPRKHYNIIFVKTPLAGGSSVNSQNVNVLPESEEKTIVYVLTGNNDGVNVDSNGEIQLPEPKPPTKPEVVFVKYNNEADVQKAISDIQANYNTQGGASVSVLGLDDNGEAHAQVDTANIEGGLYGTPINYGLRRATKVPKGKFDKLAKKTV